MSRSENERDGRQNGNSKTDGALFGRSAGAAEGDVRCDEKAPNYRVYAAWNDGVKDRSRDNGIGRDCFSAPIYVSLFKADG
jgi:hypothetical protein